MAPSTGTVTVSLCASTYDTVLAVYTGTVFASLASVATSDDSCGIQSRVSFAATGGVLYKIAVDGFDGEAGPIDLSLSAPPPPANDDFADATVINDTTATGSNIGASAEAGEPLHFGIPGGASAWWRWTPTISGAASVSTCGSGFLAIPGVYTGASVGALSDVATDAFDCDPPTGQIVLGFPATAGQTYHIAVDGFEGEVGDIALEVGVVAPPPPPPPPPPPVVRPPAAPPAPPAAPPAAAPTLRSSASISVIALPRTIGAVLTRGVRVRVTCSRAVCAGKASLLLNGRSLVRKTASVRAGATRVLALRPTGANRKRLSRRRSARLRLSGSATPTGGTTRRLSRSFVVRR